MIVSFFKNSDDPVYGIDYSLHPDLVKQENITIDITTHKAKLVEGSIIIEEISKTETPEEKYNRVFEKLVNLQTLDASTDQSVLEGLVFSDKQKGDLIVARVFKDPVTGEPNPHYPTTMITKKVLGNNDPEFLQMLQEQQQKTNEILAFFHMGAL